ncbi:MAG: FtsX-like permease family protein, partial [Bacteroidales bacterium]
PGVCIVVPVMRQGEGLNHWYNNSYRTYFLMDSTPDLMRFNEKIKNRVMDVRPEYDLYLMADLLVNRNLYVYDNIHRMRLMGLIALAVLLIACINFINLATAGFTKNSFQTGLRKILGASRGELIGQFLLNTFLITFFSFIMAIGLALLIFPVFNAMLGKSLVMSDLFAPSQLWMGMAVVIVTTLTAGIYPAWYLSSFKPLSLLKGNISKGSRNVLLREFLVAIQFCVSIVLIISTLVISKQIRMFKSMDLGYEWQEVMYLSLRNEHQMSKAALLKTELLKEPEVTAVSVSVSAPTNINWNGVGWKYNESDESLKTLITFNYADEDWASVYDLKFREGTYFSDSAKGVVINQKLLELMDTPTAMDKFIRYDGDELKIVGVLDQFKFNSFKSEAEPCVILPYEENIPANLINIRIQTENPQQTYEQIEKRAREIMGEKPVLRFLSHNLNFKLAEERRSLAMVNYFSVLAVLISCLGLFGLATFMIQQKRKEIGIRRVNGARIGEIIWLLNMSFIKPVFIGFLIACPIAWLLMRSWLSSYAEKTSLDLWIFIIAGLLTFIIAILTLVWRTWLAANENPVNCLKEN